MFSCKIFLKISKGYKTYWHHSVVGLLPYNVADYYCSKSGSWLGLHSTNCLHDSFSALDYSNVNYNNWDAAGEPDIDGEACASIGDVVQYYWTDENCIKTKHFVCEGKQEIREIPSFNTMINSVCYSFILCIITKN